MSADLLSEEDVRDMLRDQVAASSQASVARSLGVSRQRVFQIIGGDQVGRKIARSLGLRIMYEKEACVSNETGA